MSPPRLLHGRPCRAGPAGRAGRRRDPSASPQRVDSSAAWQEQLHNTLRLARGP